MGRVLSRALAWNGPAITLLGLALALGAGLLLILLTPLAGVLFIGLVVVVAATVIEPLVGLGAALFLGLLQAYLRTWIPQAPGWIAHVFVALTLGVWLARGLVHRDLRIPHPPLLLPLLVFFGAALLSLWDAVELPAYGIPELIKWVQIVLVYLFVSDYLTRKRLPWLLGILFATGLFQAAVGAWQFGLRGESVDPFAVLGGRFYGWKPSALERAWVSWIEPFGILGGRFYRAYGTFEQPNAYAGYVGMTLALAAGLVAVIVRDWLVGWYIGRLGKRRVPDQSPNLPITQSTSLPIYQLFLIGGVTLALLGALIMSWSRGAWIGFGAAAVVMAFALPRKTRWGLLLVAALAVGGLGLYAAGLVPSSVMERLTGFAEYVQFEDVRGVAISHANYAVIERLAHWQAALEMFRHNLWTGVGFGCYEPAYPGFALINWPIALGHAHNYYLNIAAETGLIGLAAYLALWGAVFWQTWRATRRASGLLRGLAIGLLGAWTHLSVHHFLDNLYVNNVHLHIGVMLGFLAFTQTNRQTEQL
jgi:O-antigen ligase